MQRVSGGRTIALNRTGNMFEDGRIFLKAHSPVLKRLSHQLQLHHLHDTSEAAVFQQHLNEAVRHV